MTNPRIVTNPPAPGTPEWRTIITASKVPAILGVSRWKSSFALWHEMAGNLEAPELPADRMAWGHIAEKSLAEFWQYRANTDGGKWQLNSGGEIAYTNAALPFPNMVTLDRRAIDRSKASTAPDRFHILECKTAATLADWGRPGEDDAVPMDYFAQVQFQMGVSGIHTASVVVLGPNAEPEIHAIEFNPEVFSAIVDRCEKWMRTLSDQEPPALDDSVSTYEAIRGLHPEIDRELAVEVSADQAIELLDAIVGEDEAKKAARSAKITAAELMGNARLLVCGPVKIADRRAKAGGTPFVQFNKKADLSDTEA